MKFKRKSFVSILLITLTLFYSLGLVSYAFQYINPFDDVNEESWYYDPVIYAYENKIMVGVGENTFLPHGELTRAMTVQMLYSIAGKPDDGTSWGCPYDDVSSDAWYRKAVIWAHLNGITGGVGNGKFAPDVPITRADLCVMLLKCAGCSSIKLPEICEANEFADAAKIPDYARLAVSILNQAKIVSGKPDNLFDPKGKTTRAEAAVMFSEFVKKAEAQSFDLLAQNGCSFGDLLIEAHNVYDKSIGTLGFGLKSESIISNPPEKIEVVITTAKDSFEIEPEYYPFTTSPVYVYTYRLCYDISDIDTVQGENIVIDLTIYYGQESETYTLYSRIPYVHNPFDV